MYNKLLLCLLIFKTNFTFALMKTQFLFDDHTGYVIDSFNFQEQLAKRGFTNECFFPLVDIKNGRVYWRNHQIIEINGIKAN